MKLITEDHLSLPEAGRRLNVAPSTINNWVKAQKAGRLTDIGKSQRPLTELEMELARVKRENAELKMERDILKKQQRTLRGSRCPVRDDERIAASLPGTVRETSAQSLSQRILFMAGSAIIEKESGRNETGGRN